MGYSAQYAVRTKWALMRHTLSLIATVDNAKTALFVYVIYGYLLAGWRTLRARGVADAASASYLSFVQRLYNLLLTTPQGKRKLKDQLDSARIELSQKLIRDKEDAVGASLGRNVAIPTQGRTKDDILHTFEQLEKIHRVDWQDGRVSGAVYHGHTDGTDLGGTINAAITRFLLANPLHPDVFPGVRKMEAEIIAMTLSLFHGHPDMSCGTTTSGGTESIVMACKAYRDWARKEKGITQPEMVIPMSAHAAFDKAGQYFGIKIRKIPVDPVSRKVQIRRVKRAINSNTILLVGSAPNFPDGIVDPIPELSALATRYKIPLHVDCCLGSFIVPFLEEAGYGIGEFDFRLPGVTSISCDTHKYGFAPKGSSIIMYSDKKWRAYQFFVTTTWPGGVYASPSLAGSRPGALLAGAWAAMQFMGADGYLKSCKAIVGAAKRIEQGVRSIPDLTILGEPKVTVIAFSSQTLPIYEVGDKMSKKGWHLNALQDPPALHICCTRLTIPVVDAFLTDLKAAVDDVKASPNTNSDGSMVQIYGMGSSPISGGFILTEFAKMYLDVLYDV